jgi:hypothetical protein
MRAVLFQNADGEDASAFGDFNSAAEIIGSEFFPVSGKFLLCGKRRCGQRATEKNKQETTHGKTPFEKIAAAHCNPKLPSLNRFYDAGEMSEALLR